MKDPNDTRDIGPRIGSPLWTYLAVVTALGFAVLVAALSTVSWPEARELIGHPLFWIVAGLIVFGELRPIVTPGRSVTNVAATSIAFSFAAFLYWGLPLAALLQAVATVVAGVADRHAGFRNAFNAAQYTLSLAAGALVLRLAGASPDPGRPWVPSGSELFVVGASAAAFFAANLLLVGVAVALHSRVSLAAALREDLPYQILVNTALLSLAPLVVVVMHRSAALLPLFVLPLVAVYTNAAMSLRREHQAHHDELTGLPNRKLLVLRAEEALLEAKRVGGRRVGLFLLDLDRFKEVNDTLGHATGDRLLRIVAHRLTHSVRPGDVVARLGGDEFAVLLPLIRDAVAAREVAARLRVALSEPVRFDGMSFDIEASVGIALHPDHALEFEPLMQRADVAMYLAKERRSGVELYAADRDRNSPARLGLLGELRRGVDRKELELFYQPKVSLGDGGPVGVEALIRWRHPTRGLLAPEEFIPLAEQSYLMRSVTQYVVDTALAQIAEWWRVGIKVQVSVNVSARDLLDTGLTDAVSTGLLRHAVPAEALQLEITERILMTEPAHAADTVDALARLGIPLSLDDFGTGYSSLVRLKRLPVQEIKIDSSFVRRILDGGDEAVIVRSIVDLVRALGLRSVAEGVESAAVAERLRAMGCDAAQGWYFSRPLSAAATTRWLTDPAAARRRDPAPTEAAG